MNKEYVHPVQNWQIERPQTQSQGLDHPCPVQWVQGAHQKKRGESKECKRVQGGAKIGLVSWNVMHVSHEEVKVTLPAGQILKWALRLGVFHVLNLQLQLFDTHVSLVEELSQPSDFLLLLVELETHLWTRHIDNSVIYAGDEEGGGAGGSLFNLIWLIKVSLHSVLLVPCYYNNTLDSNPSISCCSGSWGTIIKVIRMETVNSWDI